MRFVVKAWKSRGRDGAGGGSMVSVTFVDGTQLWLVTPTGWSGNDDIIAAMKENRAFWSECLVTLPNPTQHTPYYELRIEPPIAPCGDHRDCGACINREDCGYPDGKEASDE
jgi:hypothetical protein